MTAPKNADPGQMTLGGFAQGSVVKLDGGKRLRLDGWVDFWPGSKNWESVKDGPDGPACGVGVTSMLAFLKRVREAEGRAVTMPTPRPSTRAVPCNYCGAPAELHGGLAIYPDRKDLQDRQFWVCWTCDAWVGCQSGTDKPYGELANEELRAARISAHAAFDPVWQQELLSKPAAYDWLAQALGMPRDECRIGLMQLEDCRRVRQLAWERFGTFSQS